MMDKKTTKRNQALLDTSRETKQSMHNHFYKMLSFLEKAPWRYPVLVHYWHRTGTSSSLAHQTLCRSGCRLRFGELIPKYLLPSQWIPVLTPMYSFIYFTVFRYDLLFEVGGSQH